jgi:pimeloyl-ACP methyl ester carboxylesterase
VKNPKDPTGFNHFLAHIFNHLRQDPAKPIVILLPGILCNGNLFRIAREEGNFRDLDAPSFANDLARAGYEVVLVNPRYAKWIYRRYVQDKLGVPNKFSEEVNFKRLTDDLPFYIDTALSLSGKNKAVVAGYSLGGMELLSLLANGYSNPRLQAAVFLATPGSFTRDQLLIRLLHYYNLGAKLIPLKDYHFLNVTARHVVTAKPVLRRIPPAAIEQLDIFGLAAQICNFRNMDMGTLVSLLSYVLEPIPSGLVDYFQFLADREKFVDQEGKEILPRLSTVGLPALFVGGGQDQVVPPSSASSAFGHFGRLPKECIIIEGAGHLDLITGLKSGETVAAVLRFLDSLGDKSAGSLLGQQFPGIH